MSILTFIKNFRISFLSTSQVFINYCFYNYIVLLYFFIKSKKLKLIQFLSFFFFFISLLFLIRFFLFLSSIFLVLFFIVVFQISFSRPLLRKIIWCCQCLFACVYRLLVSLNFFLYNSTGFEFFLVIQKILSKKLFFLFRFGLIKSAEFRVFWQSIFIGLFRGGWVRQDSFFKWTFFIWRMFHWILRFFNFDFSLDPLKKRTGWHAYSRRFFYSKYFFVQDKRYQLHGKNMDKIIFYSYQKLNARERFSTVLHFIKQWETLKSKNFSIIEFETLFYPFKNIDDLSIIEQNYENHFYNKNSILAIKNSYWWLGIEKKQFIMSRIFISKKKFISRRKVHKVLDFGFFDNIPILKKTKGNRFLSSISDRSVIFLGYKDFLCRQYEHRDYFCRQLNFKNN